MERSDLLTLTADIAAAHVSNNTVSLNDLPAMISGIYGALAGLGQTVEPPAQEYAPAVDPKRSVKPDALISLIDGRRYKMLKRHLANHGLTPDQYRSRYGLAASYPMVAPNYAEQRRALAKKIGLGTMRNRASATH